MSKISSLFGKKPKPSPPDPNAIKESAQALSDFVREVALGRKVWTIRDAGGFPSPMTPSGVRAQPFWSSLARVERIIETVPAYSDFRPHELSWDVFRDGWISGLTRDGLNVGLNWSGAHATGFDVDPAAVLKAVEGAMGQTSSTHITQLMPTIRVAENTIRVGKKVVVEGPSPTLPLVAVFEDDGETGYFYALDTSRADNPIVDALHIYDVEAVTDRKLPSKIQIAWSPDHRKAVLLINDYPHAVFDFVTRRGYCRDGFPPGSPAEAGWSPNGHDWDDAALEPFLK